MENIFPAVSDEAKEAPHGVGQIAQNAPVDIGYLVEVLRASLHLRLGLTSLEAHQRATLHTDNTGMRGRCRLLST